MDISWGRPNGCVSALGIQSSIFRLLQLFPLHLPCLLLTLTQYSINQPINMAGIPVPDLISHILPFTRADHQHVPTGDSGREEITSFLNTLRNQAIGFNALDPKPAGAVATRINVCPWEIEYQDGKAAETHLRRIQNRHNQLDPDDIFTNREVAEAITNSGRLNMAITHHLNRGQTANFYLIYAMTPWANFQSADRDGWFVDFPDYTQEQKRAVWASHQAPGHVIAVKVKDQTVGCKVSMYGMS